jgi:ABC-type lipoprotein export system ATPase subunit
VNDFLNLSITGDSMSANDNSLIEMKGIKKVFYTDEVETHALTNVHLTLQRGDYVSISGPSGCGKTTLLSILGLLDSPTTVGGWARFRRPRTHPQP